MKNHPPPPPPLEKNSYACACGSCAQQSVFSFHLTTAIRCVFAAEPCVVSDIRYRNPYNCKYYYTCPSGTLEEDICDEDGLGFDPTYSSCNNIDEFR